MVIYIPNEFIAALKLIAENHLGQGIVGPAALKLTDAINSEQQKAPYQLWLRDQKHEQANREHSAGAAEHDTGAASRTNKRNKAEQVHSKTGRRLGKKQGGKGQSEGGSRKPV